MLRSHKFVVAKSGLFMATQLFAGIGFIMLLLCAASPLFSWGAARSAGFMGGKSVCQLRKVTLRDSRKAESAEATSSVAFAQNELAR